MKAAVKAGEHTYMKELPRKPVAKGGFIAKAWENEAKDAEFAKLTLAKYRGRIQESQDLETEIAGLEQSLAARRDDLKKSRKALSAVTLRVVNAVRADDDFGSDSSLLAAMGYTTDSQRKSGLTKKNGNGNGNGTDQPHS